MKCAKCGQETNSLIGSGRQGNIRWENLNYCHKCLSEYRKKRGIKSLRELNDEYGRLSSNSD